VHGSEGDHLTGVSVVQLESIGLANLDLDDPAFFLPTLEGDESGIIAAGHRNGEGGEPRFISYPNER
jgi:hypothetical protein